VPQTALTPAIRQEIERSAGPTSWSGSSFKNAATIGYVVRRPMPGSSSTSWTRTGLVNSTLDPGRHGLRRGRDEPPDYIEQILPSARRIACSGSA
jgi:hypothetical protein